MVAMMAAFAACGSDDSSAPAGGGGTAGAGGSTGGTGGSTGGTGGSAGTAGSAGSSTGGTGGTVSDAGEDSSEPDAAEDAATLEHTCTNPPEMVEAGASDAGATCNLLLDCGPTVTMKAIAGAAPTAVGGTIADGTYVLTAWNVHGTTSLPGVFTGSVVMVVNGSSWEQSATQMDVEATLSLTVSTSGTTLTRNYTCPGVQTDEREYTVSGDKLILIQPDIGTTKVEEYTKIF